MATGNGVQRKAATLFLTEDAPADRDDAPHSHVCVAADSLAGARACLHDDGLIVRIRRCLACAGDWPGDTLKTVRHLERGDDA